MSTPLEIPALPHDADAWKLFVFRKSRERISARVLLADLKAAIAAIATRPEAILDALVRAGEIETGLADAGSPAAGTMAAVVDHLAAVAGNGQKVDISQLQSLNRLDLPEEIICAHPEGFSFYGLNPLDFADLARRVRPELKPSVAVIGIRSVGSTLGAVVAAVLRTSGRRVERITVRPEGEPYHRRAKFSPQEETWVRAGIERDSDFLVVDEGPGFSGSTFLSVAHALIDSGVPCARIVLMGSRPFATRGTQDAQPADWSRFRRHTIDYASHRPFGAERCLGDGAWRQLLYRHPVEWPACWAEQERIKYLSSDARVLFKFEGFGRFGQVVREQAALLDREEFCPRILGYDRGFVACEFVHGRTLTVSDLSHDLLSLMANYCAFRAQNFVAPGADPSLLKSMARVNLETEFGPGKSNVIFEIPLERPVYPDCRLLPHEWLLTNDGRVLKADAVGHGDGHQFPGPADIAWDLAGVIVEWNLSGTETEFFLREYRLRSGDDAANRLAPYLLLYAILRTAQCRMASASMARYREARYLHRQYLRYSQLVGELLDEEFVSY